VCEYAALSFIKWFSPTDVSDPVLGLRCFKVDKYVAGVSWRDWASWFKLARYLDDFPF
jgi:hypothetical protein